MDQCVFCVNIDSQFFTSQPLSIIAMNSGFAGRQTQPVLKCQKPVRNVSSDAIFWSLLGAFDKLKESEFYEAQPNIPTTTENGEETSKVAVSYKAGTVIVSQRQVDTH